MIETIMTLITIAFIAIPFFFVTQFYKKEKVVNDLLTKLKNESEEPVNTDNQLLIDQSVLKVSTFNICYYAIVFFLIANVISLIFLYAYMIIKQIPFDVITNIEDNAEQYEQIINDINPILQFSVYLIAIAGVIPMSYKIIIKDIKTTIGKYFGLGAMGLGLLYGANLISNILMILLGVEGDSGNQEAIINMMQPGIPTILMFFATVIFAPILEELVFRKSIFNLFPKKPYLALVVSSVAFGALHVVSTAIGIIPDIFNGNATYLDFITEFFYIIPYCLMGYALGYTYIKSDKNIVAPIFAHMLNNLLSFIMILVANLLYNMQ